MLTKGRGMRTLRGKRHTLVSVSRRGDNLRLAVVTLAACLAASHLAVGQWMGKQTGCYADSIAANSITANPNRPTVANPADITQYGVLELEYGWDRLLPGVGVQQTSVGGLLKFGMLCDVELRWNTTSFLSQTDASGTHRSFGDNWLGPQIRVYRQTKRVPTLAFAYAIKIPSASTKDGLGTGHVDHAFTFLGSKDIRSDPGLPADETGANAGLRLRHQNTLGQHERWLGNGARGSRIYLSGEQRYRAISLRFQLHPIPDRTAEYVWL